MQGLQGQQPPDFFGKHCVQSAGANDQNRTCPAGFPQAVAAVLEGRQLYGPTSGANPYRQKHSLGAMLRRRTENHRQNDIRRRGRNQQNVCVHVGVEHAIDRRNAASGQKAQSQHTARHSAGHREKEQQQPQKALLTAVSDQTQQDARRQLDRHFRQKPAAREKDRRRVRAARQRGENVTSPAQRKSRQTRRRQQ